MSILYDTHMHSSFSTDSDAPAKAMVLQALDLKLRGICFTDHMDLDYPSFYFPEDPSAFVAEPAEVYREILHLRDVCAAAGKDFTYLIGKCFAARYIVGSDLHILANRTYSGKQIKIRRFADNGEGHKGRRMRMEHRIQIRPHSVDREMERQFG